ncbi:hypothetical protein KEM52_003370 [Ascosphaera acerosa]|nr:hypothetical protein KEM52_003370 [Ascosphaera acerosa]
MAATAPTATATPTPQPAALQPPPSLALPPSQFARLQPHAYLLAHLDPASQSRPPTRPDGRARTEFRPASLNTGSLTHANGSAVVRIGDAAAACGVRAEILYVDDIPGWMVQAPEESERSTSGGRRRRRRTERGDGKEQGNRQAGRDDDQLLASTARRGRALARGGA